MTIRLHLCLTCHTAVPNTIKAVEHEQAGHRVVVDVLHLRTRGKGASTETQWSTIWKRT